MTELIADTGFAYISYKRRLLAYVIMCPDGEETDWDLIDEDKALQLEARWRKEDEQKFAPPAMSLTPPDPLPR